MCVCVKVFAAYEMHFVIGDNFGMSFLALSYFWIKAGQDLGSSQRLLFILHLLLAC